MLRVRHGSLYNYLTTCTRQLVAAIDFKFDVLKVFIYDSFKTENESHVTTWAVLTLQNKFFFFRIQRLSYLPLI